MRLIRHAALAAVALLCGCSTLHPAGGFTADSGGAAVHGHRRAIFAAASPGPLEPPAEINCISASVTPCASTSHIGSGNEGEPAWLIFGKLNDWGLQLGLFSNQAANQVVATPNGTSGIPGPRSLVSADLPSALSTVTSVNGTLIPASTTLLSSTSNGAIVGSPTVLSAPTQSAPTTSTTGGTLAAGTYYYVVTATTAYGETTASGEQSITTTGTTSENVISWSSVTGATGYRIYRGTAAGAENTYYAVGAVTTYTDTGAAGTTGSPPAVNTTNYQGPGTINSQGCYVNGVSCGGGGSSAFSAITAGTNTSAAMVVGTGASLGTSGSGTIAATTSAALATTPTQCTAGQYSTGIAANGNANCGTPAGAGTVTNFSFTNGGGFAGTVATPTTTPALSIAINAALPLYGYTTASLPTCNSASKGEIAYTTDGTAALTFCNGVSWVNNGGTQFTYAATGCTPSASSGDATGGSITLAAGPCTSITVTFNGAVGMTAGHLWDCAVHDQTALAAGTWIPGWSQSSSTTTTATIPIPAAAGSTDVITFSCTPH